MKTLFLAAALSGMMLVASTGTAVAQRGGGMMAGADTNGDGIITQAEFMAQAAQRFQRMDTNSDGKLSGDELRGRMAEQAQGGAITRDQFMAESETRFQRLDANHDGKITQDEMQAMMQRFRDRGGRGGQPGGDTPPPPGAPAGAHGGWHDGAGMFEKLDANHDGRISREEMRAAADRKFDRMDTNHDGYIDKAESEAAHKMHRHHRDMPPPGAANTNTGQ